MQLVGDREALLYVPRLCIRLPILLFVFLCAGAANETWHPRPALVLRYDYEETPPPGVYTSKAFPIVSFCVPLPLLVRLPDSPRHPALPCFTAASLGVLLRYLLFPSFSFPHMGSSSYICLCVRYPGILRSVGASTFGRAIGGLLNIYEKL